MGLYVNPKRPWLAASPDALVHCECCGYGAVEIKCPYSIREDSLKDVNILNNFYVKYVHGQYKRDTTHSYCAQIQMEMSATNTLYGDFVVWTPQEMLVVRIPAN